MNPLKDQITEITLDVMMGIREGVGQCRVAEFSTYLDDLIRAKEADISPDALPNPLLTDRVRQGVEAALAAKTDAGVDGGLSWSIITMGGSFDRTQEEGLRVKVDMEFVSAGAPALSDLRGWSVDDLNKLKTIVNE